MGYLFIFLSLIFLSADLPLGFLAACDQSRLLHCKEGKSSSDEAARAAGLTYPTQRVLLDLELWGAEIDQQAVLNPRGTQVVDSFLLRLLRLFAAERLSPPVPSDGTCPL